MSIISFDGVYKNFADGSDVIHALKPTSFSIEEGELVAIVGPSGSGKSTLLTLMGGLQTPTGGTIKFMNNDLSGMSEKEKVELRFNEIGFILQTSNLIPFLRIKDQFKIVDKFAKRKVDYEKARKIMDKMDILKRENLYPKDLSGGEKQRAAISRALYIEPKLVLADEPTASLDTKKAMYVIELLAEQTRSTNRSTVLVTHDERLLSYCDRVLRIVDGELTEVK